MKIDYYGKPIDSLESLLEKYNPNMYLILDDVLESNRNFRFIYQQILDILKWGFEIKEIRTRPIHFKFHREDKEHYTIQLRHFLSNMILWQAFIDMDQVSILNESFIFDFSKFSIGDIMNYINNKILPYHEGDFASKNKTVDEICYHITAISNAFCLLMGMGISIYDIIQAEKNSPEIGEIIFGSIDPTLQPIEIEAELNRRTKRLIELFTQQDCDLKPLFLSGKNISEGQFKEIAVKIGLKSDINGHTIPLILDANLLVTGINKPSYLYIESMSGRKSLILTKTRMGEPGAFSKKVNLNTTSASVLRKDYELCDSAAFVDYKINDDLFLRMLDKRYYYDSRGNMQLLNYHKDKHLIGKIVPFRSPCTCSSEEGICKYCYGELFKINENLFSVGSFAATKSSEPLGQTVLSSKHFQGTTSNPISFNEDFDKVFELASSEVSLREDADSDEESLSIILDSVNIEEQDDQEFYYTNSFKIVNEKGQIVYNIQEENGANMYLTDQLLILYKKAKDKSRPISLDSFDSESAVLFTVEIKNKELTEPIKIVQKILNSNDKLGAKTLSEVCQVMAENFLKIGIQYDFVHLESVIRSLLRKKSSELEFPDWSRNGDHNDYQIMRLNAALFKNPSALVSLSYGDVRRQLISPDLYNKTATSHVDPLFTSQLSKYI